MIEFANQEALGYFTIADLGGAPVALPDLFGTTASGGALEVEIGAGRGDFALDYARSHPAVNIVAVERKLVILRRAANKQKLAKVPNVVFLLAEAKYLFENYIPAASVDAVHIYFPDPWPKKRHRKRRIAQPENLDPILRSMRPGAHLYFRTDFESYFSEAMELFSANPLLKPIETPDHIAAVPTAYEAKFMRQGQPIYRAAFRVTNPQEERSIS